MSARIHSTPFLFMPFVALWRLVTWIFEFTGRLLAVLLGGVLLIAGLLLTLTVIGAIVGIPLMIIGFMLAVRGIF